LRTGIDLTDIEHVVKDLERKAEISREIHIASSKKCKRWINFVLIFTMVLTMVIAFLSLAGPLLIRLDETGKNIFGILISIAGLVILFLSVSDRIFGLNERYASHLQHVKLLTDLIRDCHQFRHVEMKMYSEEKNLMKLDAFQKSYSQIHQLLPLNDISDSEFLKIKQNYYIKVDVSKKLDENHYLDIDEAMKTHKSTEILEK
jgi:hypothetical protein